MTPPLATTWRVACHQLTTPGHKSRMGRVTGAWQQPWPHQLEVTAFPHVSRLGAAATDHR